MLQWPLLVCLGSSLELVGIRFGKVALGLQATGLVLETVADYQKSTFKALTGNRNQWCNVGLFKYSTFPNYLGEISFWYGTFLAGMASFTTISEWTLALFGVFFVTIVIRGAITSLGAKQMRKYGSNPDFVEFRRTHQAPGPLPFQKRLLSRHRRWKRNHV
jgi:steroid 5-alpha reductase family enzyme